MVVFTDRVRRKSLRLRKSTSTIRLLQLMPNMWYGFYSN